LLRARGRFTAGFGVAEHAAGEGFGDLLGRADQALYAAKHAGRDCVRLAAAPPKPIALCLTG
jgi:PleD family two-component response regulator